MKNCRKRKKWHTTPNFSTQYLSDSGKPKVKKDTTTHHAVSTLDLDPPLAKMCFGL